MGQRHQLFIIAKIAGRYRGLAALHKQFGFGLRAVARCCRLLEIFQAPENQIPIQQELLGATTRDEAFWNQEFDDSQSNYAQRVAPFPFISAALLLGGSFDPDRGLVARVHSISFNMPFDYGGNDDGITIIDITEQAHPRYCFVFFNEIYQNSYSENSDESDPGAELCTPLSASSYLKVYGEQPTELLEKINEWRLIDVGALEDAWPHGGWEKLGDGDQDVHASGQVKTQSDQLTNNDHLPDTPQGKFDDVRFLPFPNLPQICKTSRAQPESGIADFETSDSSHTSEKCCSGEVYTVSIGRFRDFPRKLARCNLASRLSAEFESLALQTSRTAKPRSLTFSLSIDWHSVRAGAARRYKSLPVFPIYSLVSDYCTSTGSGQIGITKRFQLFEPRCRRTSQCT